jgi:hypothetical protein
MTNRAATLRPGTKTLTSIVARDARRAKLALDTLATVAEDYESQTAAQQLSLLTHMSGLDAASATTTSALAHLKQAMARDPMLAGLTSQAAAIEALWALIGLVSDHHGPSSEPCQRAWRHAGAIFRFITACAGEGIIGLRLADLVEGLESCSEA